MDPAGVIAEGFEAQAHMPASTLLVVKSLALPELLFEIETIAVPAGP
jgi:hypothetical protein